MLRTQGLATKVLVACGAQAIALIVNFAASGEFDRVEWAQLLGVGLTAVLGYIAPPNEVKRV